jgi:hypothetical protein
MKGAIRTAHRKGIGLKFPNWDSAADGDVNEPGDAGESPGKSSLFFLTTRPPWNRFSRR